MEGAFDLFYSHRRRCKHTVRRQCRKTWLDSCTNCTNLLDETNADDPRNDERKITTSRTSGVDMSGHACNVIKPSDANDVSISQREACAVLSVIFVATKRLFAKTSSTSSSSSSLSSTSKAVIFTCILLSLCSDVSHAEPDLLQVRLCRSINRF